MRQSAHRAILKRLQEADLLNLSAQFGFVFNKKKRYPYLKITNDVVYSVADILEEEGYSLTSSVLYSNPGELLCFESSIKSPT